MKRKLLNRWSVASLGLVGAVTFVYANSNPRGAEHGSSGGEKTPAPDYVLHEWGTFTTVSGSDGVLLPGLQKEEERLPGFVRAHHGMNNIGPNGGFKGFMPMRPLANVFVKMETPVVYFYADNTEPFSASVDIGFAGGSISQWFPPRTRGESVPELKFDKLGKPTSGTIDFGERFDGSIGWDVEVLPKNDADNGRAFQGSETMNWIYPRMTDSNLVRTSDGSLEKYLFYRGVGKFDLPLVTTASASGNLTLTNRGDEAIPGLLVFDNAHGKVRYRVIDDLPAGATMDVALSEMEATSDWHRPVYDAMRNQLTGAGLYGKEADAMVQTWWQSYFQHHGQRVFWLVPDGKTESVLPLEATPAPRETVRVLVGRSEVLTPEFEAELVEASGTKKWLRFNNDRYSAAYSARADALTHIW